MITKLKADCMVFNMSKNKKSIINKIKNTNIFSKKLF